MARGRPAKPIALHHLQGTFRPDRHGKADALERRIQQATRDKCDFCGWRGYPLVSEPTERHRICRTCLETGLQLLDSEEKPDETA